MARAKSKPSEAPKAPAPAPRTTAPASEPAVLEAVTPQPTVIGDILTLAEAAAYLRLPEAEVKHLALSQGLPGRFTGKEWRFLKAAIQDWLRAGLPPGPSREAQMAVIGSWKDDPYIEEELKEIYRRRGRPMTEDES